MSATKTLCFNAVSLTDGLNFAKCPNCGKGFMEKQSLTTAQKSLVAKKTDFNQKIQIKCPSCGHIIELFVAFHKYEDSSFGLCIQKSEEEGASGIPANWWVRT